MCFVAVFWNVENFYDYREGKLSRSRFYSKCDGVAKEIFRVADAEGELPLFVGLAEVENGFVVNQLVRSTLLGKTKYRYVHYDSPDHRGIDCALLYDGSRAKLLGSKPCHLYDADGRVLPTRDILQASFIVEGRRVDILVNHHPSKYGGKSDAGRLRALSRMTQLRDSLASFGGIFISLGDFNDTPGYAIEGLKDLALPLHQKGIGSIRFGGQWELIDRCYVADSLDAVMTVFEDPQLLVRDSAHGGLKPRRTFSGPRYLGGISDHLPIVVNIQY